MGPLVLHPPPQPYLLIPERERKLLMRTIIFSPDSSQTAKILFTQWVRHEDVTGKKQRHNPGSRHRHLEDKIQVVFFLITFCSRDTVLCQLLTSITAFNLLSMWGGKLCVLLCIICVCSLSNRNARAQSWSELHQTRQKRLLSPYNLEPITDTFCSNQWPYMQWCCVFCPTTKSCNLIGNRNLKRVQKAVPSETKRSFYPEERLRVS